RQGEDLQGGVLVDEVADGAGGQHHHQHGDDDGGDHHRHVLHQAHGGDHRVQGEDDVDDRDLQDDAGEAGLGGAAPRVAFLLALDAVPDFQRALEQQEQAAEEQDQVAARDALAHHREQVGGQAHHPGDRQQQQDARAHGQGQADKARPGLLVLGQARNQDGNEDDVVDAQDDFQ